jgi:hypothetical protein
MGKERVLFASEFISKSLAKDILKENAEDIENNSESEKPLVLPDEF